MKAATVNKANGRKKNEWQKKERMKAEKQIEDSAQPQRYTAIGEESEHRPNSKSKRKTFKENMR